MGKMIQGRVFPLVDVKNVICLSFTADNKFLVSSHEENVLLIWNIVDSELYKQFNLNSNLIYHCFTPDNQFMLSIYQNQK